MHKVAAAFVLVDNDAVFVKAGEQGRSGEDIFEGQIAFAYRGKAGIARCAEFDIFEMKQSYAIVHFRDDADGVFAGKQHPADVEFEHEMRRGGEIEFKLRCAAFIAYEFVFVSVQDKGQSVSEKFFRSGGKKRTKACCVGKRALHRADNEMFDGAFFEKRDSAVKTEGQKGAEIAEHLNRRDGKAHGARCSDTFFGVDGIRPDAAVQLPYSQIEPFERRIRTGDMFVEKDKRLYR